MEDEFMKMLLTDLHIHSTFSDGKLTISEIVDFYGKRGFDIIAITDHLCEEDSFLGKTARYLNKTLTRKNFPEYIRTIKEEGERAIYEYGMLVIPGFELTKNSLSFHRSAHILGIGIDKFVQADGDAADLIKKIKDQGAMVMAAHPVSTRLVGHQTYHLWDRREELRNQFDAWEVACGPHFFDEVQRSGLPLIANTDFHHPAHIESWKTLVRCEKRLDSLAAAIRKQELEFIFYKEAGLIDHLSTSLTSHLTTPVHLMANRDLQ